MFGLLVNPIVNLLSIGEGFVEGRGPSKQQVAQLFDDGMTIGAIAVGFDVGIDVIEALLEN
jgi:hypothetical protein